MKRFFFLLVISILWLGSAHAQTRDPVYIKKVFGTLENFQAIIGADKVTACMLGRQPDSDPTYYQISETVPGPEKELPADLVRKLREVLSDAAAMYDAEAEEPVGGSGVVLRYTFHVPDRKIHLYFRGGMSFIHTRVGDNPAGGCWVNQPAISPLRAIAKSLFPTERSL